MKTEGAFFFPRKNIFSLQKGRLFQNKRIETEKICIGTKKWIFFSKGAFIGFTTGINITHFLLEKNQNICN